MAKNEVKFIGDAASLKKAYDELEAKNAKLESQMAAGAKASRAAAAEERKRLREAAALSKANETEVEKANRKIAEAIELSRQQKISQETLNRELAKQNAVLDEAAAKEARNSQEQRERNLAALTMIAKIRQSEQAAADARIKQTREAKQNEDDLARAAKRVYEETRTPQEKYNDRMRELNTLLREGKLSQDAFGRASRAAFAEFKKSNAAASGLKGLTAPLAGLSSTLLGLVSVTGAVYAGLRQIRKEYDNLKQRQDEAASVHLSIAGAEREAIGNLGINSVEDADRLRKQIDRIAEKTGAHRAGLYGAASAALSFKGDLPESEAYSAVEAAAMISPDDPEAISSNVQGILAQKKRGGGTASQIAGFQMAVKRESPVTRNADFAKNIAPGISDLIPYGATPREAAAILATIGHGMNDSTGAETRTAASQLAKQLALAAPGVQGPIAQIEAIRNDPEKRKAFLGSMDDTQRSALAADAKGDRGTLTGEAKAFVTFMDLFQKETNATQKLLDRSLERIPTLEEGGRQFQKRNEIINSSPYQRVATTKRTLEQGIESIQVEDVGGANASIGRKGLRDLLRASGASALDQDLETFGFAVNGGISEKQPIEKVYKRLRRRQESLRQPLIMPSAGAEFAGYNSVTEIPPSESSLKSSEQLGRVADKLEELINQRRVWDSQPRESDFVETNSRAVPGVRTTRYGSSVGTVREAGSAPATVAVPEGFEGKTTSNYYKSKQQEYQVVSEVLNETPEVLTLEEARAQRAAEEQAVRDRVEASQKEYRDRQSGEQEALQERINESSSKYRQEHRERIEGVQSRVAASQQTYRQERDERMEQLATQMSMTTQLMQQQLQVSRDQLQATKANKPSRPKPVDPIDKLSRGNR